MIGQTAKGTIEKVKSGVNLREGRPLTLHLHEHELVLEINIIIQKSRRQNNTVTFDLILKYIFRHCPNFYKNIKQLVQ